MAESLDEMDVAVILALAENGMSVTETAKATYFARRTVYYRMERIEKKTGLNPSDFYDLCALVERVGGDVHTRKRFCEDCGIAYKGGEQSHYCPTCRIQRLSNAAKDRGLCYIGGVAHAQKYKGRHRKRVNQ